MSTFMAKANEVERKWYIIDAAGFELLARIELKDRKSGREYR